METGDKFECVSFNLIMLMKKKCKFWLHSPPNVYTKQLHIIILVLSLNVLIILTSFLENLQKVPAK